MAELFTVFVGVYAAFLLNAHQQHRQEQQRRAQLLNWLERVYTEERDSIRREAVNLQTIADRFNGDLAAGNRPALHSFDWISRLYSR